MYFTSTEVTFTHMHCTRGGPLYVDFVLIYLTVNINNFWLGFSSSCCNGSPSGQKWVLGTISMYCTIELFRSQTDIDAGLHLFFRWVRSWLVRIVRFRQGEHYLHASFLSQSFFLHGLNNRRIVIVPLAQKCMHVCVKLKMSKF